MSREDGSYYDLGSYRRSISASNAEALEWFNRGLIWSYAFNHEESAKCFERAIQSDNNCCMAYWGLAYTLGPNYNKPWEFFDATELEATVQQTHRAVEQAESLAAIHNVSAVEKAIVKALRSRYPREHAVEDCSIWNQNYADAMGEVYKQFNNDLDVAALYSDALMNLTPWQLWDLKTGEPATGAHTLEAKAVIERAMSLDGGSRHPGLLHLYIHLMEMSSTPEAALEAANTLRDLVPHAGHLNHMPTHIDVLVGDYQAAIDSNQKAILADEVFFAREDPLKFYTLYRMHDYHFRIYAAMFAGQSIVTLDTVARLEAALPEELLRIESPPMADWLEGFLAMRVHALIRFGRWDELVSLALPNDATLYCVTTAMVHYAKGVALAATNRVEEAEQERELFSKAYKAVPASRMLFNNKCVDILQVAEAMLDGELEYRRGNHESAFAHLRNANKLSYALPYDEPWGWMQPPSHALGALLAEQGRYSDALEIYEEDLGYGGSLPRALQHPNNVWSLHGYHECLTKLGNLEKAAAIKAQLDAAIRNADVPIKASCFCRLQTA
ncbi:TPR domain protein [Xylaria bambusicola]|uniref:TPR domain protein n=1 Tax=Xylaria bambusicola TaxID=326684 RepID=UPI0020081AF8|nr:TPR domain protein [Xylaria bambusicola]KAI0508813.1 TPR domain protein [Xylaria bambusicola]